MKVWYRPHRGLLVDSMREAVLFPSKEEMISYICASWRKMNLRPEDLVIEENRGKDPRIAWSETRYVCAKRLGDKVYDVPQCIGMCSFEEESRMKVEKLEVLKIGLWNEYYVLVVPNEAEGVRDFFLANELCEHTMWLFSMPVGSDDEVLEIVEKNAAEYIKWYREECVV